MFVVRNKINGRKRKPTTEFTPGEALAWPIDLHVFVKAMVEEDPLCTQTGIFKPKKKKTPHIRIRIRISYSYRIQ